MELSGKEVAILGVTLAIVVLLFYVVYKSSTAKVNAKFAGAEVGVELVGSPAPPVLPVAPEDSAPARELQGAGDISHNRILEKASLTGNQQIHVGHNLGTPNPPKREG
jgi:hypothetical protein